MPVRIGELLLKEKRITPEQLQEALNYQRQNGGKLGSNLVKLFDGGVSIADRHNVEIRANEGLDDKTLNCGTIVCEENQTLHCGSSMMESSLRGSLDEAAFVSLNAEVPPPNKPRPKRPAEFFAFPS